MIWVRRFLVSVFSLILLLALVGVVESFSLNAAFSTPTKTEHWLNQSPMYKHFVATVVKQAIQQGNDNHTGQPSIISAKDPAVTQAIQTAFPEQLINQSVATFLNGNYDWLNGKNPKPEFKIDLTMAKTQFTQQIGQIIATHLSQLPACTLSQLNQLQTNDLLNIGCRPSGIDPSLEAPEIQQQINSTSGFLSNPVITADSLNPQQPGSGRPYYQRLHQLPRIYQTAQKLPYALAALSLISALVILLAARTKRLAWRHIAKVLVTAGLILALGKLVCDIIFNKGQAMLFNTTSNGEIQRALTDFAHRAIDYVAHLNMIGGIVYLVLAAIIILTLFLTRARKPRQLKSVVN